MSDTKTSTSESDANAVGCGVVALGLVVVLALSLLPALIGPMLAPRALPVFATALCPEAPIGAKTIIVTTRSRNRSSSSAHLQCQNERGDVVRASGPKPFVASWLLFNGALALFAALSIFGFSRLDRRVTGESS
ncbi:MAG: hypothetical protein JNK05_23825 [Myxococcales bacterium]|nr:hypothetical protein [Myxococcales bacterium]